MSRRTKQCTGPLRAVGQHAKHREERRLSLCFIDHHQSPLVLQRGYGLLHELSDDRIFEIEVLRMSGGDQLAGEGGLAALAGTKQGHHRIASQRLTKTIEKTFRKNQA